MRVLPDTQCWLWMQVSPRRFSAEAVALIEHPDTELLLSAASSWEIAIKYALGKLPLPEPPPRYVPSRMQTSGVSALPVEHSHALRVAELPAHHRDPFDPAADRPGAARGARSDDRRQAVRALRRDAPLGELIDG